MTICKSVKIRLMICKLITGVISQGCWRLASILGFAKRDPHTKLKGITTSIPAPAEVSFHGALKDYSANATICH